MIDLQFMQVTTNPYPHWYVQRRTAEDTSRVAKPIPENKFIKNLIWTYFILLIFEGALRKWVLPSLSDPLLIIRDPVAVIIILTAFNRGLIKLNGYTVAFGIIGFAALGTAIAFGHGNWFVALFGFRIFVLHFPLIFIIGQVFSREDVLKVGKALLWLMAPMTILMIVQFYSPQSAWVNRGLAGSVSGAGFTGALGYFRPPGTFSFITGLAQFYGLAGAFVLYFWLVDLVAIRRWLLCVCTVCLLLSIPFSISRNLFFQLLTTFLFAIVASLRRPKYFSRFIVAIFVGLMVLTTLTNFDFFQTGVQAFVARLSEANAAEGGAQGVFLGRFLGDMFGVLLNSDNVSFWGAGLGIGTNAGAMIMTGTANFQVSEGEWGRLIGEMGLILGVSAIAVRTSLAIQLMFKSLSAIFKRDFLPWMLLSFGFLTIIQGQWAQPTGLGFAILSGGLILASLRRPRLTRVPGRPSGSRIRVRREAYSL